MIYLGTPDHLASPKLSTFVYVVAYHEVIGDSGLTTDLSFLSTQVLATDDSEAYDLGFSWLESTHDIKSMTLVNDYVHQITGVNL